jgi:two-component system LytT family response regulator
MIRTLIVDDEALAREGIRVRLGEEPDIEVVGEATDGFEAVDAIGRLSPDLVFLDVQMPGVNGLDLLARLPAACNPAVIFVTAHDQYAVGAFEAHAFDYLLKPISTQRFRDAVQRVRSVLATEDALRAGRGYDSVPLRRPAPDAQDGRAVGRESLGRLVVKDRDRYLLIKTEEIDWIAAAANYCEVHARGRAFLLRTTMNALEEKLAPERFARIHRSTIVNVDRIREIRPSACHGDFDVTLREGTTLRLSRGYRGALFRE